MKSLKSVNWSRIRSIALSSDKEEWIFTTSYDTCISSVFIFHVSTCVTNDRELIVLRFYLGYVVSFLLVILKFHKRDCCTVELGSFGYRSKYNLLINLFSLRSWQICFWVFVVSFCVGSATSSQTNKYEFNVYRKPAITDVQIKPNATICPTITVGVFKDAF